MRYGWCCKRRRRDCTSSNQQRRRRYSNNYGAGGWRFVSHDGIFDHDEDSSTRTVLYRCFSPRHDVVIVCYYIVSTSNRLPCTWRRVVWQRDNACGKQHCKRGVANPVWSGLGVTEQRVTVAIIRTQRGRLVVPIPTTGGFVVSATATVSYL